MGIPALNHWMLHNDALAQQFDAILTLTIIFGPLRHVSGT